MGRLVVLVAVAAALVALTLGQAFAASPADDIVYFPLGNGAAYSCSGGPPFVVDDSYDGSPGNCAIRQIGAPPTGLVCDIPTTITFVHEMHQWTADAKLCHSHP